MKPIIANFSTILLTLAAFCSCSIRDHFPDGGLQPSEAPSTFVVSAAARSQPSSRAIAQGGDDDNAVEEITVLFFYDDEANGYPYHSFIHTTALESVATNTDNENRWKFSAPLPKGNYKALFLANATERIDEKYDLETGTVKDGGGEMTDLTMDEVTEALSYSVEGKYNANPADEDYRPFIMSSGRETFSVPFNPANKYELNPIRLARDVAKINVRFVAPDAQFEIISIELNNYYTKSYVVAAPGWWEHNNAGEAGKTAALLADDAARPIDVGSVVTTGGLIYKDGEVAVSECVDEIFTPEQLADGADNPYLIVNGNVTIDGETHLNRWYKLEFARKDANGEFQQVNLLRNYVYTILITEIEDEGYDNRGEAAANRPNNLVFELDAREEGLGEYEYNGLGSFVYNGQYYLGVTKNHYAFSWNPFRPENFIVYTNYPGSWEADLPGGNWPSWFRVHPNFGGSPNSEITPGGIMPDINKGFGSGLRNFDFMVEAGPLRQRVTVTQALGSPYLDIDSHTMPNTIPGAGGTYQVSVLTNMQDFRLVVTADPNDPPIINQQGTLETVNPGENLVYITEFTIPANDTGASRQLTFVAYSPSMSTASITTVVLTQAPM